jgi:hypothetical protein
MDSKQPSVETKITREEVRDMITHAEGGYMHLDRLDGLNIHKTIDNLTKLLNDRVSTQQAQMRDKIEILKAGPVGMEDFKLGFKKLHLVEYLGIREKIIDDVLSIIEGEK